MHNYDIAIIGNGVLALSTAFLLLDKDSNLKIAIIGKETREGSSSYAAGAMINYIGEVTSSTLKNKFLREKLEISIQAGKNWKPWLEKINNDTPLENQVRLNDGTFVILNSLGGSLDSDNYDAIQQAAQIYQEEIQEVHPKEVPGMNPIDSCRAIKALFLPNEGSINPVALIKNIKAKLAKHNVTFYDSNAHMLKHQNNSSTITLDNNEVITGQKLLLAAGSFTQIFINQLPDIAPKIPILLAGVGISAVVSQTKPDNIQHVIRTPNRSGACGLHVLKRSESELYIGATNNIAFSPSKKQKVGLSQFLLKCAIDQIDQDIYNSEIINWRVGNRPVTIDSFPLVGKTSLENVFILAGTYRDGLHQSPMWAQYVADVMYGSKPEFEHSFKPERKLIPVLNNKEESINEVVNHYMAGLHEHRMVLPSLFPEKNFEGLLKNKFKSIYEQLSTEFPMIPDIMFLFELSENNDDNIKFFREYFKKMSY
jgi:glycine oxidase